MNTNSAYEEIEKWAKEISEDTCIDATNIAEKQYSSPNVKHKWLFRLVKSKQELIRLVEQKDDLINGVISTNPMNVTNKAALKAYAEKQPSVIELNKTITKQEVLVEYLQYALDKIFSPIDYAFKNLVELLKLEQL